VEPNSSGVFALLDLCEQHPFALGDAICIGDQTSARAAQSNFGRDLTGLEAFINHVHLGDLWHDDPPSMRLERLRAAARVLVACWGVALLPVLGGRSVIFYAGGLRYKTLRFDFTSIAARTTRGSMSLTPRL
jgi:hypothetical protein